MASEGSDAVKTASAPVSLGPDSKPGNGQAILDPDLVRLKSKISLFDGVTIIVGFIIGSGVFLIPQNAVGFGWSVLLSQIIMHVVVAMISVIDFLAVARYFVYSYTMDTLRIVAMITLLLRIVTMPMIVTAELLECEQPEDPVEFFYQCLGQGGEMVNLCLPGRHLAIAQPACVGAVNINRICEECSYGYYMSEYNYCDNCHPWKECKPGEMEDPDNPPSAVRDRVCIPVPPTTAEPPSQCPPCECTMESNIKNATTSVPNSITPSEAPDANGILVFQSELERWKKATIGLLILVVVLVIVIICQRCKLRAAKSEKGPDPEEDPYNSQDDDHSSRDSGIPRVDDSAAASQESSSQFDNRDLSPASHLSNEYPTEGSRKPTAAPDEHVVDVHNSPTCSTSSNTSCHVATPEKGTPTNHNKPFKRAYDVNGDTPSNQPLLGSNGQQSIPLTIIPSQADSLSSATPNGTGIHDAPTALYK